MRLRFLMSLMAAALLAVAAPAQAIKIDGKSSVTYAKETFVKPGTTVTGVGTFYSLAATHMISGTADIIGSASDAAMYEVVFTLQNMVFATEVPETGTATEGLVATAAADGGTAPTFTKTRGGAVDDNYAVFMVASGSEDIAAKDMLTLRATFKITADGPGGIIRTVTNKNLAATTGLAVTKTHENPDAIKVVRALKETVTPTDPNPMAAAAHNFMAFGGTALNPVLRTSVGTVMIGVQEGVRDARVASDTTADDGVDTTMVTLTGAKDATGTDLTAQDNNTGIVDTTGVLDDPLDAAGSAVTFSGEFGFVKTLALTTATANCSGTLTDIRKADKTDRTQLTDETMEMEAGDFESAMHLCIAVDGETDIPGTGPYTVTTLYKGPPTSAFPPVGGTHNLAMIGRSGTTVHIPLLNLSEGYNHRIILRNRSSSNVTYTMNFHPEAGTTATPGVMASGMVGAGQIVFLKAQDVVTLTGKQRTAATVTAPAPAGTLDVSTSLTNLETRDSDTETH